jgi:hypothetical protein
MKPSLNILILSFFLSAFCSEIFSDLFMMKLSAYSFEYSQTGGDQENDTDSPVCFDSDPNDIVYCKPKPEVEHFFLYSDPISKTELFKLRTYSYLIWQPPKNA